MTFRGVLLQVNQPSTSPPSGCRGRLLRIPRSLMLAQLPSLLRTPVTVNHGSKQVGLVLAAAMIGDAVHVHGHSSFSENVRGMSIDLSDCEIENLRASIWDLTAMRIKGISLVTNIRTPAYGVSRVEFLHAEDLSIA